MRPDRTRPTRGRAARLRPAAAFAAGALFPVVALLAVPLLSCAKSPAAVSSDPSPAPSAAPASASAPSPAREAGSQAEAPASAGPDEDPYTENPALLAYVRSIGSKIASRAAGARADTRFDIADSADVNVFSPAGGRVCVTRGLLARMSSEDELAVALGGEIAFLKDPKSGDGASAAEAPELGLRFAKDAGYRARGAVDLLRTLASVKESEPSRLELYLAGHPGSAARIANLDAEIRKIVQADADAQSARGLKRDPYLRKIDGIPVGWFGPGGYLKGSRYLDIRRDFSIEVPEGWTVRPGGDALVLLRPWDGSRAEVAALPNVRPGVSGDAAVDYAHKAPREGYEVTKPVGHATLPIGEAAIVTMRGKDASGAATSVRKMFQVRFDRLYVLTYTVPVEREDETLDLFMKLTGTIKWLTPAEAAPPPIPRIALDTVKEGETWKSIAQERLGGDWRGARLAAWNGRDAAEAPAPGMLIKVPPVAAFE